VQYVPHIAVVTIIALAVVGLTVQSEEASRGWTQWGGPHQNFVADSKGLAESWPEAGPKRLWTRELGEGYSAILVEGERLYTMYRDEKEEVVVCLSAKDGETIWEHRYESSPAEGHAFQFGDGPRSTPLLVGDQLFAIGIAGRMHALDKDSGKVQWSLDLWKDLGGNVLNHGYSSSPIEYKNTVIALVGGKDASIVAFDKKTGDVKWKNLSFNNSYATPEILEVDGEQQLVTFMAREIIGVDPDNGELKWSYAIENTWQQNISNPVLVDGQYLFFSALEAGARGIKLTNRSGETSVEELWSTRKIQFYHVTAVNRGDWVFGSTGGRSPAFMAAVNVKTGEIAWRKRGFAKANTILGDGRLIILDEEGNLALTTATPEDLTVHSKVPVLEQVAWTVPTLVGKTIYLRDKENIVALDLG
jgi:outer membrane protein assembly factor BamB